METKKIHGWVARDIAGGLHFFIKDETVTNSGEPRRHGGRWLGRIRLDGTECDSVGTALPDAWFPLVRFTDAEPTVVECVFNPGVKSQE